jgi:hypothetical protein
VSGVYSDDIKGLEGLGLADSIWVATLKISEEAHNPRDGCKLVSNIKANA